MCGPISALRPAPKVCPCHYGRQIPQVNHRLQQGLDPYSGTLNHPAQVPGRHLAAACDPARFYVSAKAHVPVITGDRSRRSMSDVQQGLDPYSGTGEQVADPRGDRRCLEGRFHPASLALSRRLMSCYVTATKQALPPRAADQVTAEAAELVKPLLVLWSRLVGMRPPVVEASSVPPRRPPTQPCHHRAAAEGQTAQGKTPREAQRCCPPDCCGELMVVSSFGRHLAAGGVPVLLSSRLGQVVRLWRLVGGLGFEHGEDDVAAASGDADDGGVVAFAL